MDVFGILLWVAGFIIMFIPANEMGIVNLNLQFVGLGCVISGAIFWCTGLLSPKIREITKTMKKLKLGEPNIVKTVKKHKEFSDDEDYMPLHLYLHERGIKEEDLGREATIVVDKSGDSWIRK